MTALESVVAPPALALARGTSTTVQVVEKSEIAEGVVTLTLAAPDGRRLPDWAPGAHIDLILPNGATRQYSLCGDRWDAYRYRVGVLREPASRGGSAYVHDWLRPGDLLGIGGPRNNFHLVPAEVYLFVAGGIGITPILPMIVQAELLGIEWRLLYGGRTRTSMAFLDELAAYGDKVRVAPQDEVGLLDLAGFLTEHGGPAPTTRLYGCGPAPMLTALAEASAAWPAHSVRTELFVAGTLSAPRRDAPFEVELARSGITVTVTPDQSVLDALTGAGIDVLSSCRRGTCGTCETPLLRGEADHRDSILDDEDRAAGDSLFVCVSRACSDRLVLDI